MLNVPFEPSRRLSRRERALVEYGRRIGNAVVPWLTAIAAITVIWMICQVVANRDRVARPMAAATRSSADR